MSLSYSEQYSLATQPGFIQKVQMALVAVALEIARQPAVTYPEKQRAALGLAVLHNPEAHARLFAFGVAAAGLNESAPDEKVAARIRAVWDGYAGEAVDQ